MRKKFKDTAFVKGFVKLKNDLKPMTFKEKCEHLWEYYKEWLLVLFLVFMGINLTVTIVSAQNKEIMVSGMMINIKIDQQGMNYLTEDYKQYLGGTSKNQVAELTYTSFGDPLDPEFGQESMYASMILTARVSGAMLDYMILDKFAMEYYMRQDVYMDLAGFFTEEELAQLEAEKRLVYAQYEGQEIRWPVAVKITNLDFVKDNVKSEGDIYFALSGSTPRPEMCRNVWNYLHAWKKPK